MSKVLGRNFGKYSSVTETLLQKLSARHLKFSFNTDETTDLADIYKNYLIYTNDPVKVYIPLVNIIRCLLVHP